MVLSNIFSSSLTGAESLADHLERKDTIVIAIVAMMINPTETNPARMLAV